MQNGCFSSNIALRLKKVCYKVYSCENCQMKMPTHFTFSRKLQGISSQEHISELKSSTSSTSIGPLTRYARNIVLQCDCQSNSFHLLYAKKVYTQAKTTE